VKLLDKRPYYRRRNGQDPLRNSGAGELSVTTGMRQREFSCLLDIEVGRLASVPAQR
jgi:hypothetical protein